MYYVLSYKKLNYQHRSVPNIALRKSPTAGLPHTLHSLVRLHSGNNKAVIIDTNIYIEIR